MTGTLAPRVVLVTRETECDGLMARHGLRLCAILSVVPASLAWFTLGSAGLTAFGFLAPLLWLYGANRLLTGIRAPASLERLCHAAPNCPGATDADLSETTESEPRNPIRVIIPYPGYLRLQSSCAGNIGEQ